MERASGVKLAHGVDIRVHPETEFEGDAGRVLARVEVL
jgi:hypothetical protein